MLKACVVGFGAIGPVHTQVLKDIDSAELYAICETDEIRMKKAKEVYDIKFFDDYEDALNDSEIDIIHICTPHHLHVDMAIKAIEKGKHVLLEKPVGISRDELNRIIECYNSHKSKVCVMLQNRYNSSVQKLKEIIDSGEYGDVISVCGSQKWSRNKAYYETSDWRGKKATEGGGLVINQSVHLIDILGWLNGGIKSVTASISTKKFGDVIEVEDTADAVFEFENGLSGVFYASNTNLYNEPYMVEIRFEHVKFIYTENMLVKFENGNVEKITEDLKVGYGRKYWGTSHRIAIDKFYNSILSGNDHYISLEDGINTMNAVYAIYESALNRSASKK